MKTLVAYGVMKNCFSTALALIVIFCIIPNSQAETITFEEYVSIPDFIHTQYCSKGVKVLATGWPINGARIFEPAVPTASPTHALTTDFGEEMDEILQLAIGFTTGQSSVSVKVGLDRAYPFFTYGVVAVMYAYSSDTPGTGFVTYSTVNLGNAQTPITQTLEVSSSQNDIRSVLIRFEGASPGQYAFEVIDDLTFSTVGPSCDAPDPTEPTVEIHAPSEDQILYSPKVLLDFTATDDESGVGQIRVTLSDGWGNLLQQFYACGGPGVQKCPVTPGEVHFSFYSWLPKQAESGEYIVRLGVEAWNNWGIKGYAIREITFNDHGGNVNLWAYGMEITQGTQPWVAENILSRSPFSTPATFAYTEPSFRVPLVAGRTTVVRVFPSVEGTTMPLDHVTAVLRCFTDNTFSTPCSPTATIMPTETFQNNWPKSLKEVRVDPYDDFDQKRRSIYSSLNFELPATWVEEGTVHLEAEVFMPAGLSECLECNDAANRIRVASVAFSEVPHFSEDLAHLVKVHRKLNGQVTTPTEDQIKHSVDFLRRIYPVDEKTVTYTPKHTFTFEDDDSLEGKKRCNHLYDVLKASFPLIKIRSVYAVVDEDFPCAGLGGSGYAYGRGTREGTYAHEVGHAFGLDHAGPPPGHASNCPRPDGANCAECLSDGSGCDSDWPYKGGTIGAFGFNVFDMKVVPAVALECKTPGACDNGINEDGDIWPDTGGWPMIDEDCPPSGTDWTNFPHDIMSYGPCGFWISDRNWIRLFNAFTGNQYPYPTNTSKGVSLLTPDAAMESPLRTADTDSESVLWTAAAETRDYILVRGSHDEDTGWELSFAYELSLPASGAEDPGEGEYGIRLLGEGGETLAERRFDIPSGHIDMETEDGYKDSLVASPAFSELLPLPAGVVTIVLAGGDELLAARHRSGSAPTVEIYSPDAAGFADQPVNPAVLWQGFDADGDPLLYMVQYSRDSGATWETIGTDLTGEQLAVNLSDLKGGRSAQVRVFATDGFNTGTAVSAPFAVADKPPEVEIISPKDCIAFESGTAVFVTGAGFDLEDGPLNPDNLGWHSSRDGLLGWGNQVGLSALSVGIHSIILQGFDRAGQVGFDMILVEVTERINTQPVASAGNAARVQVGRLLELDGTASHDEDGDPLLFQWSVVELPAGSSPELMGQNTATPAFRTNMTGNYAVQLIVSDGKISSIPDIVSIEVIVAIEPVANAGADQTVERTSSAGAEVQLDGSGSYSPEGRPLTFTWSWLGGSASGVNPLVTLPAGETIITMTVSDGELSATDSVVIMVIDTTPPKVVIMNPEPNSALQDGIIFQAQVTDISEVDQVYFYVREPDSVQGLPIGHEDLKAVYNNTSGYWEYPFDTTALLDSYYVILAKALDTFGNEGWSQLTAFSIRNWAVIALLPSTSSNKAGRTMPVKFSLRIAASVDPAMPFVYNDDLEIRIYRCSNSSCSFKTLMQTSVFGSGATDYRIDSAEKLYITNFQTVKLPAQYVVEIWRPTKNFMVGSFTFNTTK